MYKLEDFLKLTKKQQQTFFENLSRSYGYEVPEKFDTDEDQRNDLVFFRKKDVSSLGKELKKLSRHNAVVSASLDVYYDLTGYRTSSCYVADVPHYDWDLSKNDKSVALKLKTIKKKFAILYKKHKVTSGTIEEYWDDFVRMFEEL